MAAGWETTRYSRNVVSVARSLRSPRPLVYRDIPAELHPDVLEAIKQQARQDLSNHCSSAAFGTDRVWSG